MSYAKHNKQQTNIPKEDCTQIQNEYKTEQKEIDI